MRRALVAVIALTSLPAIWSACSEGDALDLTLAPDPNLATERQLAEQLSSLVFILDSEAGLYQPGEELSDGALQVKDADADASDLEVVVTVPVEQGTLPTLRIERGGLPDVPIDVRVLGLPLSGQGAPIAEGLVRGLRFTDGALPVTVPFDPRDEALPPRVVDLLPGDGDSLPGCTLATIVIVFSKPIEASSLDGHITLDPDVPVTDVSLDPTGLVATVTLEALSSTGESLRYGLTVGSDVRDLEGRGLDQAPHDAEQQAFEVELEHPCVPPPLDPPILCGSVVCLESPRMGCVDERCTLVACSDSCAEGTVCEPLDDACALDCRSGDVASGCLGDELCDLDSGLCAAP